MWRCGRRFGKTTGLEVKAANDARHGKRVGWFAPTYKLLKPSYKRILQMIRPAITGHNLQDGLLETWNDGCVEFWTLTDEDAGRSRFYDLACIDEGSLIKRGLQETWEQAIRPTLLDRNGTAIMAGTPKGIDPDNFFYEASQNESLGWKDWHAPTALNPILNRDAVEKLRSQYPPLVYQQEFLAEFVDWSGAAFFALPSMLDDLGNGYAYPARCDVVFATVDTAIKTGKENDGTAVVFWARTKFGGQHPLMVLDYDIVQIEGALLETWLPSIFRRLDELAKLCGARRGSAGVHIEDKASGEILLQQGRRRGWAVHAIDGRLTDLGKDERAISVSGYVWRREVKLSAFAHDKLVRYKGQERNHFITQVCGFRIGVKDQADDLADAYMYGISIGLGDSEGY